MAIGGNDAPRYFMDPAGERSDVTDEDVIVAWIDRHPQGLSSSRWPGDDDLTQLSDDGFTENQSDRLWRAGEPGIGGRNRPK